MENEWVPSCLRDEADLLAGFPFKSEGYTDATDGVRLLRGDNIVQAALRWDGVKHWPKATAHEFSNYALAVGDVVVAMDRPWIEAGLKFAAVSAADLPCLLVQRTARIRGGNKLDVGFLRYLIGSREFTQHVLAVQTGTTIPHISARQILDFEFLLPPLPEQKRIAHILGTLDDKIELNRRMNATLEGISRAIFKSWFVDFDPVRQKAAGKQPVGADAETAALFPDSFEDSEIGEVPTGWRAGTIGDCVDVVDCLHTKKPERVEDGKPLLQLANIRDDGLLDMADTFFISDEDFRRWSAKFETQAGDCVITNVGRVGAVAQIPPSVTAALGRNMTGMRPKGAFPFPTFLIECLLSSSMRDEIGRKTDSGTILNALNVKSIPRLRLPVPRHSVAAAFERLARPLRSAMEGRLAESRTLANLRDTLLPKLLSGEIRVPEAEEAVEEADPVIQQLHDIRHAISDRFAGDIDAIARDAAQRLAESGRPVRVRTEPDTSPNVAEEPR